MCDNTQAECVDVLIVGAGPAGLVLFIDGSALNLMNRISGC